MTNAYMDYAMTEDQLSAYIAEIANEYGYTKASGEFVGYKDFKVRWARSYQSIQFQISDYLGHASPEAIKGLMRTIMSKIANTTPVEYSKEMKEYALCDEFLRAYQPKYIQRSHVSKDAAGKHIDLKAYVQDLVARDLIDEADVKNVEFRWKNQDDTSQAGWSSTLMSTVIINDIFDDVNVNRKVLDHVLSKQILMIRFGREFFGKEGIDISELIDNCIKAEEPSEADYAEYNSCVRF